MNGYDFGYGRLREGRFGGRPEPGGYGGLRSDAHFFPAEPARTEFGPGGGMYDVEYDRPGRPVAPGPAPQPRVPFGSERIRAADLMTPHPEIVGPEDSIAEAARMMAERDIGMIPVVDVERHGELIGVITDRDIAIRAVARGADAGAPVREFMTDRVVSVDPDTPLRQVIRMMGREQIRRVPVVDRSGRLIGILAQADLTVDYAGFDPDREREVAAMIERISEPGRPRLMGDLREWITSRPSRPHGPFDYW